MPNSSLFDIFVSTAKAIRDGKLITRESIKDKEFHFQNWFSDRLRESKLNYELGGRNSYPDFRMVNSTEGYEVKGLAYPGREANYDCNSQVPSGKHNGREIFYVFGRYPSTPDGNSYPVLDLVICHGDFLNADHEYLHKNKSVKGFGSYGDIMIRDRKMYVAPTPFGLTKGAAHNITLIVPKNYKAVDSLQKVGELTRKEAETLIIGYTFDLQKNTLIPKTMPNPKAGTEHIFSAYRVKGDSSEPISMRNISTKIEVIEEDNESQ